MPRDVNSIVARSQITPANRRGKAAYRPLPTKDVAGTTLSPHAFVTPDTWADATGGGTKLAFLGAGKKHADGGWEQRVRERGAAKQNIHAERYRSDPAYRKAWHASHGNSNPFSAVMDIGSSIIDTAKPIAPLALAAYGLSGALGSAANPMGSGFTGTGPGVSTHGLGAAQTAAGLGSVSAGNALNNVGNTMSTNWLDYAIPGASLASGYLSSEATGEGIDEISRQYDQTRADMAPWRRAGMNALSRLENFDASTIEDDPMYQLALEESLRAVNRRNSARGLNLSGNALIDEARTAAAIASGYGGDIWNRQAGLAGVGQTATNALASLGADSSNQLANLYLQRGQGWNNALQGGLSNYLSYDLYRNNPWLNF